MSSEEFNEFNARLENLKENKSPELENTKKCGNIIKTYFVGFQEIFKRYIIYACPELENKNMFKDSENAIYDLITKQFFGDEINEEIYKAWRKNWVTINKIEYMVDQLKEFGVDEWQDVFEGQTKYKEEIFKKYYKKHHKFDWINELNNDAICQFYFWLKPAFAIWTIYQKLGIDGNTEDIQAISTEKKLKRHYLLLVLGHKLPALRIFLLHALSVEKVEAVINEILLSKKNKEEINNSILEFIHYLWLEYLATNNEKVKNLFFKTIKELAKKKTNTDAVDVMKFTSLTEKYRYQANKGIKQICDRPSLLNENEINALKTQGKSIILEVKWENKKNRIIKAILISVVLISVLMWLYAKIWGIEIKIPKNIE